MGIYTVETSGSFKASAEIEAEDEEQAEEKFLDMLHRVEHTISFDFENNDVEVY